MTIGGQQLVTMSCELRHTIRDMEGSMETTASALLNTTVLSTVWAVGLSLFAVPAVGQEHRRDFRQTQAAGAGIDYFVGVRNQNNAKIDQLLQSAAPPTLCRTIPVIEMAGYFQVPLRGPSAR
jgi:hypothetical protein